MSLGLAAAGVTQAGARSPSPAPDCLDARAVQRVRHFDPDTLLVGAGGRGFVVDLPKGCGAQLKGPQTLLAEEGWVCGRPREFVRARETLCPILAVAPVAPRDYARLAMQLDQATPANPDATAAVALEPVEVTASAERKSVRFRGEPDYCFSPAALRGFQMDGGDEVFGLGSNAGRNLQRGDVEGPAGDQRSTCAIAAVYPES